MKRLMEGREGSNSEGHKRGKRRPVRRERSLHAVRSAALGPNPPTELAEGGALFADIKDWAREEEEEAQTYGDWLGMERYAPTTKRNTIYLLPLGLHVTSEEGDDDDDGDGEVQDKRRRPKKRRKSEEEEEEGYDVRFDEIHPAAPTVAQLAEFVGAFFRGLKVKVMRPLSFVKEKGTVNILSPPYQYPIKTKRSRTFANERLYDMDVLRVIKEFLPKDGYCVVAITARDIYEHPRDDGEIVLGRGTGDQVGVISLYHHGKPQGGKTGGKKSTTWPSYTQEERLMWKLRTCKTLAHEMCHIFGIDHCVYYSCLMNAQASPDGEDESEEALHLCPIDLRKLHQCIGFDIRERYERLLAFYAKENWKKEEGWMKRRIDQLSSLAASSERKDSSP